MIHEILKAGFDEDHLFLKSFFAGKLAQPDAIPGRDNLYNLRQSDVLVLDLRPADVFLRGFIPGSINVPDADSLDVFVEGPLFSHQAIYLISDEKEFVRIVAKAIERPRLGRVMGWYNSEIFTAWQTNFGRLTSIGEIGSDELPATRTVFLDVRSARTLAAACFTWAPDAMQVPFNQLQSSLSSLPFAAQVTVASETKNQASMAASLVCRLGFNSVYTVRQVAVVAPKVPSSSSQLVA